MIKNKILYLITQSNWGGAQKYVFDLATNLDAEKYDITVAAGSSKSDELFEKLAKFNHIKIKKFGYLIRPINIFKDFIAIFEIADFIKKNKFNIIHLNSFKAGVLGSIASKLAGCPKVIYTIHGFAFNEPLNFLRKKVYFYLEKYTHFFKDIIITVSEYDYGVALLNRISPREKLVIIHNGIGNIDFLSKEKARKSINNIFRLNLEENDVIVGTVANFYSTKGLPFFIDAIAVVAMKYPLVKFLIIGEGIERQALEEKIKERKLTDNIFIPGKIKEAAIYMKAFDVFVLPSLKEGSPYVLLEAGLAMVPIITTKVGGVPEIVSEDFFVIPQDVNGLSNKIIYTIENIGKLQASTQRVYEIINNRFRFQDMLRKTFDIYQ